MDLVLLPGMNCSPRLWDPVSAALRCEAQIDGGVQIHAPHLEGNELDACVDHLLERLPPTFALAGLSLGGIVAMALARRAPERVRALALLDTNARPPTPEQVTGWETTIASIRSGATAEAVQRDLLPLLLSEPARRDARVVTTTLAMASEVGGARLLDQLELQRTRVDERPRLRRIAVPTLVLGGGADALCPPARHEEIAALVPGAELVILPGVGHLAPLEDPAEVAAPLVGLLRRV